MKLRLSQETIRVLDAGSLDRAVGGQASGSSATATCNCFDALPNASRADQFSHMDDKIVVRPPSAARANQFSAKDVVVPRPNGVIPR
jgi:hypothetical protein